MSGFCEICHGVTDVVFDLGVQPICNNFLSNPNDYEETYPLRLAFCKNCSLLQLEDTLPREKVFNSETFNYLSSSSTSVVNYYTQLALELYEKYHPSSVIEIAGNDGVFLKPLLGRGINLLNVEPAHKPAEISEKSDVPTMVNYFEDVWQNIRFHPNMICAFDVLAHAERLDDMMVGITQLMSNDTIFVAQYQDTPRVLENLEFDTIYHEHARYFSLYSVSKLFAKYGLKIVDYKFTNFYGGSFYTVAKKSTVGNGISKDINTDTVRRFVWRAMFLASEIKKKVSSLDDVVGIGAPMKSSTLLNYCKLDNLRYLTETNQIKIGKYSPGVHVPVVDESKFFSENPKNALLLSWNMRDTILPKLRAKGYDGRVIVPIPEVRIL